jgi:hypothetical protein
MIHGKNMQVTLGDSSKLQGDLNFTFDQPESEVNLHKATSLPESPSNVSVFLCHRPHIFSTCHL